ncbi:MAG: hypothetical protein KKA55_01790 [Proteobacteria bacterium]|nr:hypothetical protein [Pseudomonadota bacterium]MBU1594250.1 hypothetical protein [Pseudomonadota bacterium]
MSEATIAIMSACLGAVAGSLAMHWSTGYWAKRARREAERKIALVILSRIMWIKAMKEVVSNYIVELLPSDAQEMWSKLSGENYTVEHSLCLIVSSVFRDSFNQKKAPGGSTVLPAAYIRMLKDKHLMGSISDMDAKDLSLLDANAITIHYSYTSMYDNTSGIYDIVENALANNDIDHITEPETLMCWWRSLQRLIAEADLYIEVLKPLTGISDKKQGDMYSRQMLMFSISIRQQRIDSTSLQFAASSEAVQNIIRNDQS